MDFQGFDNGMDALAGDVPLAAAVSGGPDSMALLWLLARRAAARSQTIHAYTVDHGLRAESADEASQVGAWVKGWPGVIHHILRWEGAKPDSRILEEARAARYNLISEAMAREGLSHLCVAHHRDDQAETFLIRLAKGSGLDGLAGMRPVQARGDITLLRPFLDMGKDDLIALCGAHNISYVTDPTNGNEHYLRPRLRAAREILEEEGLSAKRLSVTARRMARARDALEKISAAMLADIKTGHSENSFSLNYKALRVVPEEIVLRILLHVMDDLRPMASYGPRMESVEDLIDRILRGDNFRGATLGGCVFALDRKNETLLIEREGNL